MSPRWTEHAPRLNRLAEALSALRRSIRIADFTTPLNVHDARTEVLDAIERGEPAPSPRLLYRDLPSDDTNLWQRVNEQLSPQATPLDELVASSLRQQQARLRALRSRDPQAITAAAEDSHDRPSRVDAEAARQQLMSAVPDGGSTEQLSDGESADLLQRVLLAAELDGEWKVVLDPRMTARMSVSGSEGLVRVREGTSFRVGDVRRLIAHELGIHLLRSVNGRHQSLHLLGIGLTGYLGTEEGLAVHMESVFGATDPARDRLFALRLLAVDRALEASFGEVVDALVDLGASPAVAFEIGLRAKRGMIDTSQPGSTLKDHVYFSGKARVAEHLATFPRDLPRLMATKLPLSQQALLDDLVEHGLATLDVRTPADLLHAVARQARFVDPSGRVVGDDWPQLPS